MIWLEEARLSLHGSWLLLIRNTEGYRYFAQSEDGFWRSFSAIVIIAPLYLYATTVEIELPGDSGPVASPSLAAAMVALVVQWIGWPLAMVPIARLAGLQHGYARYIIAYNWSSVMVIALMLPPLILLDIGLVASGPAIFLSFVLMMAAFYFRWYVARTALETTGIIAAGLVLGDFVLSLAVNRLIA